MHKIFRIARMGFWLGATIFGGVTAAYPHIRTHASELGEIQPEEVDALYALAVFLPGPSFLNLWGAVSARAGGLLGALVGELALLMPSFLVVMLLPLAAHLPYLETHTAGALYGAIWSTVGLMAATGVDSLRRDKSDYGRLLAAVALVALLLGMHPMLLLLLMIGGGATYGARQHRKVA
jgi:chromate transport protein ChrA